MDWKRLKDQNNIGRTGNVAHGNPLDFIVVGVDDGYSYDEIAPLLVDDRDRAILRYACKDTERIIDDLPDEFVDGFRLTGGNVDPIHFWQVITSDGKSLALTTDGRCRNLALRIENERRAEEGKDPIIIDAIADTFLGKNPSIQAMRNKRLRNRRVPETLAVHAEAAGEWASLGEKPEGIAKEMGVSVEKAKDLLAWAPLFPKFCAEARERANDGTLRLRGAKELVAKFPTKAEQEAYFAGKIAMRDTTDKPRPLSPRTVDLFKAEIAVQHPRGNSTVADAFTLGLRLASGDKSAVKELPDALRAAWLRAQEQAAKKPRKDK